MVARHTGRRKTGPYVLTVIPNPAVSRILRLSTLIQVGCLEAGNGIGGKSFELGVDIDSIQPRRVQTEDLGLIFAGQPGVSELLAQLIRDLEPLEGIDDPLG